MAQGSTPIFFFLHTTNFLIYSPKPSTYTVHRSKETKNIHTRRRIQSKRRDPRHHRQRGRRRPAPPPCLSLGRFKPLKDVAVNVRRAAAEPKSMNERGRRPPGSSTPLFRGHRRRRSRQKPPILTSSSRNASPAPPYHGRRRRGPPHRRSADPQAGTGRPPLDGAPPELHRRRGGSPPPKPPAAPPPPQRRRQETVCPYSMYTKRTGIPHPPAAGADGWREIPRPATARVAATSRVQKNRPSLLLRNGRGTCGAQCRIAETDRDLGLGHQPMRRHAVVPYPSF